VPTPDFCDGIDNDCDPTTPDGADEATVGNECDGTDSDLCAEGVISCDEGVLACTDLTGDNPDICDDFDNDCDPGTVDGVGDPRLGEMCDGRDSDLCREGALVCRAGGLRCSDTTGDNLDVCDGADNDCNPATLDGAHEMTLGVLCDGADLDLCPEGALLCMAGVMRCSDVTGDDLDICDGRDNDCNPATPDGQHEPSFGDACDGTDSDLCPEGTIACAAGLLWCTDTGGDNVEICDGLDNDCDPATWDGIADPRFGESCDGPDSDLCLEGINTCREGTITCNDTTDSTLDVCDGLDNDCDPTSADGSADTCPDAPGFDGICSDGRCDLTCAARHADCNMLAADGCESDLRSDAMNCGACGVVCASGDSCVHGVCGGIIDISGALDHTCAALSNGRVQCWGGNYYGQLGDGTTTAHPTPAPVTGITNAIDVTVGSLHSCAALATGQVKCWGRNSAGELGDGTTIPRTTPVMVSGISNAISVSSRRFHTCAVLATGEVKCWGQNRHGVLGDGTTIDRATPVTVSGITNATAVGAGDTHNCARLTTGRMKCWGRNINGQLGDGTTTNRHVPVFVPGLTSVASLGVGDNHTCASLTNGHVLCWGYNWYGQVGRASSTRLFSIPTSVPGIVSAASLATGHAHTCARLTSGQVECWGRNYHGQLGDGTQATRPNSVAVSGMTNAASIAAGTHHTCAVLTTGYAQCWGYNSTGALGDGTTWRRLTPVTVVSP